MVTGGVPRIPVQQSLRDSSNSKVLYILMAMVALLLMIEYLCSPVVEVSVTMLDFLERW